MNCRTIQKWIHEGRLQADADAPLAVQEKHAAQVHFGSCTRCAQSVRAFDLAMRWVHELPAASPSENFDWRLRLRLSQVERDAEALTLQPSAPVRNRWTVQFAASAAAAAALVFVVGWFALQSSNGGATPGPLAVDAPATVDATPQMAQDRRGLPDLGHPSASWVRVTPTSAGAPLGPEPQDLPAPSILGEVASPQTLRLEP